MRAIRLFDFTLGADFWNYRLGQVVSLLGDSCSTIALAWWILEKTGSAGVMSSVLAPAMIVRVFLLPLLGPIGDKFSRKHLIVFADAWRFIFSGLLALMVFANYFNLTALIATFIAISVGSALFAATAASIVPDLVTGAQLQQASQQTQAVNSFASVAGGIVGGLIVSITGVFGAFLIDAHSYLIATLCTLRIKANTRPQQLPSPLAGNSQSHFTHWMNELWDGFKILHRIPVLFWICAIAMLINFVFAPLAIVLPVFAKEGQGMPVWYLGALESSIGVGAILGAIWMARAQRFVRPHTLFVMALGLIGCGILLLPLMPTVALPLLVLFLVGVGSSWTNIQLGTQIALTIPNRYRARIGSIMGFVCMGVSPIGIAASGFFISEFGLTRTLMAMGATAMALAPLMLLIPNIREFLAVPPKDAPEFFHLHYSGAFESDLAQTS